MKQTRENKCGLRNDVIFLDEADSEVEKNGIVEENGPK